MSEPSPLHFFETLNSHQKTWALKAAIDLDLFTAISEGNDTADKLAKRCNASERGIGILADFMVITDFLTKSGNAYSLTEETALFLSRKSPAFIGGAMEFLLTPELLGSFPNLTEIVRTGRTTLPAEGTVSKENPVWIKFATAMGPIAAFLAQAVAQHVPQDGHLKVLDIAAGHGMFGITIAQKNPNAEIHALDWKSVLTVASENAKRAGVESRHHLIPGSAFETDFGSDYDLILLTNFLHHFDIPTCENLLKKVHKALKPGGYSLTVDMVPNDDRVTPAPAASFSMMMLATTESGNAYTKSEYQSMFANTSFKNVKIHAIPPGFQSVIEAHK